MAIINNVAYSWSMITLSSTALGIDEGSTTLEGVSAIKWSKKRKVESNYGMGGRPVSRGFGNITYTASITMDYATQQLLRSVYGSLLEIGEFDLIISYICLLFSLIDFFPHFHIIKYIKNIHEGKRDFRF